MWHRSWRHGGFEFGKEPVDNFLLHMLHHHDVREVEALHVSTPGFQQSHTFYIPAFVEEKRILYPGFRRKVTHFSLNGKGFRLFFSVRDEK